MSDNGTAPRSLEVGRNKVQEIIYGKRGTFRPASIYRDGKFIATCMSFEIAAFVVGCMDDNDYFNSGDGLPMTKAEADLPDTLYEEANGG